MSPTMAVQDIIRSVQVRAGVIYGCTYVCHNSSACHVCVMWPDYSRFSFGKRNLGVSYFSSPCNPKNKYKMIFKGSSVY